MMGIRRNPPRLPRIVLSPVFWQEAGKSLVGGILANILEQKQADGSPLKRNADSTRDRKKKAGLGDRSLVAKQHRFVQGGSGSWRAIVEQAKQRITIEPSNEELRKLVGYVGKKGYTGYLGMTDEAKREIIEAARQEIRRLVAAR